MSVPARVFVIDDDDAVRAGLRMLLQAAGFEVADFASAEAFLACCSRSSRGCIISDLRMPELDGLQLQARLEQRGIRLPMIMLTGHADVPSAVQSLKAGAIDFMQKPYDPEQLIAQVRVALNLDTTRSAVREHEEQRVRSLARLTPREREVVARVANGHSNKVVAADLAISERTVELHRARGMKKLDLRNLAELVQFLGSADATRRDAPDSSSD